MRLAVNGNNVVKVYQSGCVRDEDPAIEFKLTPSESGGTALSWRIVDPVYVDKAWHEHCNSWSDEWTPQEVRREAIKIVVAQAQRIYAHILEG